jgi:hypothetical protein
MALVGALSQIGHPDGIGVLEKLRGLELDGRVRRESMNAVRAISTGSSTPESLENFKESLSKLEEEHRKLRAIVEETRPRK